MVTFIRWRAILGRGDLPDTSRAATFARMSTAQVSIIILMVLAATGMARGFGI